MSNKFKLNDPVKHIDKQIYNARFLLWSKNRSKVGIIHNHLYAWGVGKVLSWYDPSAIVVRGSN